MNSAKLSTEERKTIAKKASDDGFNKAIAYIYSKVSMQKHEYILNELSLRHTAWTGLISAEINTAVVIETGLGAVVSAISDMVDHVYALYLDVDTKSIVEARLKNNGLEKNNICHCLISEVPGGLTFNPDETLLVAYMEEDTQLREDFLKIKHLYNINYYYFIDKSRFFLNFELNKNLESPVRYHIEGEPRDPFKLTSQSNKVHQFGLIKYTIFNLYAKYSGKYIVKTNLDINKSFYMLVANNFFDMKSYKIRDVFFIKPNGILLLIDNSKNKYMLRITSDALGQKRLKNNNLALKVLAEKNIDFIPIISGENIINGYSCSVEECISGRNITANDINGSYKKENIYKQAIEKLIIFHRVTLSQNILNEELYARLIKTPLLKSKSCFSNRFNHVFDALEIYLNTAFLNKSLPLVLYHGDYSADNLMIQKGNITGIIDWEYSIQNCLPLIDLVFLFCNVFKKTHNVSIIRAMHEVIILENLEKIETHEINLYCNTFNISKALIRPLSIMCLVYFIAYRLENNSEISRVNIFDKNFSDLLESINESLNI